MTVRRCFIRPGSGAFIHRDRDTRRSSASMRSETLDGEERGRE